MTRLRYPVLIGGALTLILGLGFAFHIDIVTDVWPWPDGRLSYLFIGSILAAMSAAMLWIGWVGEWGALPAGLLNLLIMALTITIYFFYLSANGRQELLPYAIVGSFITIITAVFFPITQKIPLQDQRTTPKLVYFSFCIFVVALLLTGGAMILRIPIFPWEVNPDSSVIFGCIFLSDAFYFIYALLKPRWHNALGQLLSFLFYDLVLIFPFINLFRTVAPERMLSLILYVIVLVYSGAIAIYFLFIHKETRMIASSHN